MSNIQGNINQFLGTAGVLAQLSPELRQNAENKRELQRISKSEAGLEGQVSQTVEPAMAGKYSEEASTVARETLKNIEDIRKRKYELDPTNENYKNYITSMRARTHYGKLLDIRRENAMDDMESKKGAKITQRRNFMDYIGRHPTSLGGTVGELPKEMQKQIASQYDRNARRRMMNQMDKEAMKSGK